MALNGNDLNDLFQQLTLDIRSQRFNEKRNAIREIDKRDLEKIANSTYKSPRGLVQMLVQKKDMNHKTIKKLF